MKKTLRLIVIMLASVAISPVTQASATCSGQFINPISDICWRCLFPMTLGSVPIIPSNYPDTPNPSMPISYCPKPPPIFVQIGLNIGYWEPYALTDVTRVPYCMVNMGMELSGANMQRIGGGPPPETPPAVTAVSIMLTGTSTPSFTGCS